MTQSDAERIDRRRRPGAVVIDPALALAAVLGLSVAVLVTVPAGHSEAASPRLAETAVGASFP